MCLAAATVKKRNFFFILKNKKYKLKKQKQQIKLETLSAFIFERSIQNVTKI